MRSYVIGAAYRVPGCNHRLGAARYQGVEPKEEGRCR
jgi:hypothetical protein